MFYIMDNMRARKSCGLYIISFLEHGAIMFTMPKPVNVIFLFIDSITARNMNLI